MASLLKSDTTPWVECVYSSAWHLQINQNDDMTRIYFGDSPTGGDGDTAYHTGVIIPTARMNDLCELFWALRHGHPDGKFVLAASSDCLKEAGPVPKGMTDH